MFLRADAPAFVPAAALAASASARYGPVDAADALGALAVDDADVDADAATDDDANYDDDDATYDAAAAAADSLPIDAYADEIIDTIEAHRVTIIHGETGCGKSSRLPVLLERAYRSGRTAEPPTLMVAQPRRLAVRMLADRLSGSDELGGLVGYRMGHGLRREDASTRVWYVTVGYVVRVLAHRPAAFDAHTHLVIDEVHERSVDHDVLTLLAKRLLATNPRIRLVLMSATIAGERFAEYFRSAGAPRPPILFVGARRFPVTTLYLADYMAHLPPKAQAAARLLAAERLGGRAQAAAPSAAVTPRQLEVATALAAGLAYPGASVLVFVAGMAEIEALSERFDALNRLPPELRRFLRYAVIPVHSDVPHDEQLALLAPQAEGAGAADGEAAEAVARVIVATNAVESSVTLADVDAVICLGQCKRIAYDVATHRQRLEPAWISQASAQQRAGRTGRVRPGAVYRVYSAELHAQLPPFEVPELQRAPLDKVILDLRAMLRADQRVLPVLQHTLDPPDTTHVARAFLALHAARLLSRPDDGGRLTALGSFVAALGTDLALGRLVGLGVQFGVPAEAVAFAAALSLPTSPFAQASALVHDPRRFAEIVASTVAAQARLDGGDYCEPLLLARLLHGYEGCADERTRRAYAHAHRCVPARLRAFADHHRSLRARVARFLGCEVPPLLAPAAMGLGKLTALRLLLIWVFRDQLIVDADGWDAWHASSRPRERGYGYGGYGYGYGYGDGEEGCSDASGECSVLYAPALATGGAVASATVALSGQPVRPATVRQLLPPGCAFELSGGAVVEHTAAPATSRAAAALVAAAATAALDCGARAMLVERASATRVHAGAELVALYFKGDFTAWVACEVAATSELAREGALGARLRPMARDDAASAAASVVAAPTAAPSTPAARAPAVKRLQLLGHGGFDDAVAALRRAASCAPCVLVDVSAVRVIVRTTCGAGALSQAALRALCGDEGEGAPTDASAGKPFSLREQLLAQTLAFPAEAEPRPRALLADTALGARVLAALASESKKRDSIRLPDDAAAAGAEPARAAAAAPPVGSAQWAAARAGAVHGGGALPAAAPVLRVGLGARLSWRVAGGALLCGRGGRRAAATLQRHTPAAVAVHLGGQVVFGVAAVMLDLQGGGARCAGVTLLPPGVEFVALGLAAFGAAGGATLFRLCPALAAEAAAFDASCGVLGEALRCSREHARALQALFRVPEAERFEAVDTAGARAPLPLDEEWADRACVE
jgi:HrpA-like RNA helicase